MSKNIFVVVATTEEMCIERAGDRNDVQHSIMHIPALLRTITYLRMTIGHLKRGPNPHC